MLGRWIVGISLLVWVAVVTFVLLPDRATIGATPVAADPLPAAAAAAPSTAPAPLTGLPYRGAGMQIQRVDWMDKYKKSIDEIAADGLDTVSFVVDSRQENGSSARIYLDMRMTPTPQQLGDLITHAKDKGLRVILMPIVLLDAPRGTEWRGRIAPAGDNGGWESWWDSYRSMILHFAWIAQSYGVDVLSVGSELVSTEDQRFLGEWHKLIAETRKVFKGRLTYSSNWDHYTYVKFWDQLDLIGMNSYWKLGDNKDVSVDRIKQRWADIQAELLSFQRKVGKPLMFLEVGWCSLANAASEPWDYTRTDEALDLDLQKRLYEAFFQSWYGKPYLGGFIVWEWTPGDGGPGDRGYTPAGKPAEDVLRQWLKKPRWDVKP
jgi:hypothetical protein